MNRTIRRETVLAELRSRCDHPTAEDLFLTLRRRMPRLSLGTVYRNLEQLAETGLIRKLEGAGRSRRYDGNTTRHHHLRCTECGGVSDLFDADLAAADALLNKILLRQEIDAFSLEFSGRCPRCRDRQESLRK